MENPYCSCKLTHCVGGQVSWTNVSAVGPVDSTAPGRHPRFGYNQRPPPRSALQCAAWMRNYCAAGMQGRGMFMVRCPPPQHGLSSKKTARITSYYGAMRSLSIKWP